MYTGEPMALTGYINICLICKGFSYWFGMYSSSIPSPVTMYADWPFRAHSTLGLSTILGPSLFIIYVNDLLYTLQGYPAANIEMYADDTILYTSDLCPENACRVNEEILNSLYNWCLKNKLTINFKKTKHMMIFCNNKQEKDNANLTIKIGTEKIDNVSTYHYLGIDLDSTLSYDKMLDCMYNKANRKLYKTHTSLDN